MFVGVYAGIVAVCIKVCQTKLGFNVFFAGSIGNVLINEKTGLFFLLLRVADIGGTAL